MSLAVFLLTLFAVARVTRFFTDDTLAAPLRDWVAAKFGPESKPYELITCTWCSSIWVSAPAAVVAYLWGGTAPFVIICTWLGISWIYSIAAQWLDGEEN